VRQAAIVTYSLMVAGVLLGLWLTQFSPVGVALLLVILVSGLLYNRRWRGWYPYPLSPFFSALTYGLMPLFAYVSTVQGTVNWDVMPLVTFAVFATCLFQILWLGELKDLDAHHPNLLWPLGCHVTPDGAMEIPELARQLGLVTRLPTLLAFLVIAYGNWWVWIVLVLSALSLLSAPCVVVMYPMDKITRMCAATEIFAYLAGIVSLWDRLGVVSVAFLSVYPVVFLAVFNYVQWSSVIAPRT